MKNFDNGYLQIILTRKGGAVSMSWQGKSDDSNPSVSLNPYLEQLVNELKGDELFIEYNTLKYMNSSTVMPIMQFMKNLEAGGIKTMITYDSGSDWQRATFSALQALSCIMNNITVKAI
ncbi:hypothetical protein [Desulfonema magnum]|uniref:Uncharacterized protein n=1 Tax=Desulfonema magnum TaxID=45655 RepID=A0A975GRI4_9BACT|nr:hypothetical protein [Desulfonema magnum]QTA91091.1 Uncharacterized protein dnm_071560 [Desulfonema magnum]